MILKSIYLENFRIYKGPEEIQIASNEKKITIIKGNNDAGKTTLINAIIWCLYGNETEELSQNIYNVHTFENTEIGEMIPVIVKLNMEDSEGNPVSIIRKHTFYKNDENSCSIPDKSFDVYIDEGNNTKTSTFPENYIDTHLPNSLKDYFLFDGELLTQFFEKDNGNIKKDVFRLSQLNLLNNISKRINDRKKEFISEKKVTEPLYADLLEKKTNSEEKLKDFETKKLNAEKSLKFNEEKLEKARKQISKFGDNPQELFNKRDNLNDNLKDIEKDIKKAQTNYRKFLFDNFSSIYGYSILKHIEEMGETLKEEGFIPSKIKKNFLEFLLNQNECICGRDLEEGSKAYDEVNRLFEETDKISDISDSINKLLGKVESMESNYPTEFLNLDEEHEESIIGLEDSAINLQEEINGVKKSLENISEEGFNKVNNDINYFEGNISTLNRKIGGLERDINIKEQEIDDIEKELVKVENTKGDLDILDKKIKLCDDIYNASKMLYDELVRSIHDKLQNLTSEEFNNYHWKDTYSGVVIDDDFNVNFQTEDGRIISSTDPSAGTQLTLALSFITALNSLAGFELPIVIDTPLGRLDNDIRNNLGKFLPKYTQDKQVILLVTGNEYSGDFKKNIDSYVGASYELNVIKDNGKEITQVK